MVFFCRRLKCVLLDSLDSVLAASLSSGVIVEVGSDGVGAGLEGPGVPLLLQEPDARGR